MPFFLLFKRKCSFKIKEIVSLQRLRRLGISLKRAACRYESVIWFCGVVARMLWSLSRRKGFVV
jgi:hypothetical protein